MKMSLAKIKDHLRAGAYAWPGGYPLYFICVDGEALSFKDVRENWREVVRAHLSRWGDPCWTLAGCGINWEDTELVSAHSYEKIESAYGQD